MDSYKILFNKTAEKELRKIQKPDLERIVHKVQHLSKNPRPEYAQMLKGEGRYYRIRQGDFRIVYEISDSEKRVAVIKIGHRREVYNR